MYKNQLQLDSSIHYAKLAYKAFIQLNDYRNSVLSLLNTSDGFLNLSKNDSALKYFFLAEKVVLKSNDTLLVSNVYRSLGVSISGLKITNWHCIIMARFHYHVLLLTTVTNIILFQKRMYKLTKIDSARKYLEKITELKNIPAGIL